MYNKYRFSTVYRANQTQFNEIEHFLRAAHLDIDDDVECFVAAWAANKLVACGGLAGHILKSIAIDDAHRGDGLSLLLLTELRNVAMEQGNTHLFLYTKPENKALFQGSGFYLLAEVEGQMVLMENSPDRLQRYCQSLKQTYHAGQKIGAIVMNANPFTLGHRYLIEQAASQCDWLHVFPVKEEASQFSYRDRLALIREGSSDLSNITVHEGSEYIISRATFPTYFIKDKGVVDRCHTAIDLQIFRRYLAPALSITHRFVGTEPTDVVTNDYNKQMAHFFSVPMGNAPAITVVEIPRLLIGSQPISASYVRALLKQQKMDEVAQYVPATTQRYLLRRNNQF